MTCPIDKLTRADAMAAVTEGIAKGFWEVATNGSPRVDIPNELLFDAIRQGVRDAMWQLMTNATDAPCADFFQAIEDGAAAGIEKVKP